MTFDISKLVIPYNYCLIKPDRNFDTYQIKGRETQIHVAPWGINQASHISVTGTVYKTPSQMRYLGKTVKTMRKALTADSQPDPMLPRLREQSLAYDVPMEIYPGQKVYYEYTTRLNAMKEGRIIDTTDGEMMLVPYDILVMAFNANVDMENLKPQDVRMLNGWVLIKPLEYALEKDLTGVVGVKTASDLFKPVSDEDKYVKFNDIQFANVIACGCHVKDYIDYDKAPADDMMIGRMGQKIAYDARMQKRLEVEHHHIVFKQHILYRIHRKDIMLWYTSGRVNFFKTAI